MDRKHCKVCGELKSLDAFYRTPGTKDGHRGDCIDCNLAEKARRNAANPEPARDRVRRWRADPGNAERLKGHRDRYRADGRKKVSDRASYLKRKYDITLEDYDSKMVEQGGVCGICGREPRPDISLHVDHNHETGELRGLLCFPCNVTIGLLREDHDRLTAVARYLHQHDPEWIVGRELVLARIATLKRSA